MASPLKLNLGAGGGDQRLPDYINVDMAAGPNVDVVWDLRERPWPWGDSSVEAIHSSHFIEHLAWDELRDLFIESYRVLIPGGKWEAAFPPLNWDLAFCAAHKARLSADWFRVCLVPSSEAWWMTKGGTWVGDLFEMTAMGYTVNEERWAALQAIIPGLTAELAGEHFWNVRTNVIVTLRSRKDT